MRGAGKYDDACTIARAMTSGKCVALIVIDGDLGSGFSVQIEDDPFFLSKLPDLLEDAAKQIRADLKRQP